MASEPELEELARRARADPVAFGELYDRLYDLVYRYVRAQVESDEVAEDLCEQVFLAALESLERYSPRGGGIQAWILRIARNDVLDHFRRVRRISFGPLEDAADAVARGGPEHDVVGADEMARLRVAISQLPEEQRQVILLRYAAELPIADVAKVLGKTEGAVKAMQHRAVAALSERMVEGDE